MKKWIFSIILVILAGVALFAVGDTYSKSPLVHVKILSLTQRLIPIFYPHPKDRIIHYVQNANDLFALSKQQMTQNPQLALESALRAENDMTLMVAELRRLQDTSIVSYSLIFDAFTRQSILLNSVPQNSVEKSQFEEVDTFMKRNQLTTKTIYYNRLPPEKSVDLQGNVTTE